MKTSIAERETILERAADRVCELLRREPAARLLLSAHGDCLPLYRQLRARMEAGTLDLSRARFFGAAEFEGLPEGAPESCRSRLRESLLAAADPEGVRTAFLTEENAADYDAAIEAAGGLTLSVLGLGERGRVGFNEPGTPFDSSTHRQKLTKATKRELSALFGSEEQTPDFGYTVGIHTLLRARRTLVLALGGQRADPVFRMLYARTDSFVPAAFLQLSPEVEIFLDPAAASKL